MEVFSAKKTKESLAVIESWCYCAEQLKMQHLKKKKKKNVDMNWCTCKTSQQLSISSFYRGFSLKAEGWRAVACAARLITDNSSQWCVSGLRYCSTDIHKCSQNKREPNVPVASSISVLISDRRTRAYSRHTVNLSNVLPIKRQSKIWGQTQIQESQHF